MTDGLICEGVDRRAILAYRTVQIALLVTVASYGVFLAISLVRGRRFSHLPWAGELAVTLIALIALAAAVLTWPPTARVRGLTANTALLAWCALVPSLNDPRYPCLWCSLLALVVLVVRPRARRPARTGGWTR